MRLESSNLRYRAMLCVASRSYKDAADFPSSMSEVGEGFHPVTKRTTMATTPPLGQATGYGVVIGLGFLFA